MEKETVGQKSDMDKTIDKQTRTFLSFCKAHPKKIFVTIVVLILLLVFLRGSSTIQEGDTVTLLFEGTLEDGTVFDTTTGKEPLVFVVGSGEIISGLDEGIRGMETGETKTLVVQPENAYGFYDKTKIGNFPTTIIEDISKVNINDQLFIRDTETGSMAMGTVKEISEDTIVLDLNHPLVGKTLTFDIEILDIDS